MIEITMTSGPHTKTQQHESVIDAAKAAKIHCCDESEFTAVDLDKGEDFTEEVRVMARHIGEGIREVMAIRAEKQQQTATRFEEGKTYYTRSTTDHDHIISITIARRTPKTVVTTEGKRLKIKELNGVENVEPWGQFSMSPMIGADKEREQ